MKHKGKIIGVVVFCAAVFLVGCGEQSVSETSSSSVESSTASVETSSSSSESSSSSTVESSVDMGNGSTEDIAVIVTDNQDILTSNSTSTPDTSEPTSSNTSKPTSDTHEPTSEPTTSSSSGNTTTSNPTSSSSSSGGNTSTPTSPYWNPDAPGNKPGPYGGYYDASGKLHAIKANIPKDSYGYPVVSYEDEYGDGHLTKADKEARDAEIKRINEGGHGSDGGLTWDDIL